VAVWERTDEQHNAEGTLAYPASPRSAAQVIAFWETVHIPDSALDAFTAEHEAMRQQYVEDAVAEKLERWKKENPDFLRTFLPDSPPSEHWQKNLKEAEREIRATATVSRLRPSRARTALRVYELIQAALCLDGPESAAVLAHEIVLDGRVRTVKEIADEDFLIGVMHEWRDRWRQSPSDRIPTGRGAVHRHGPGPSLQSDNSRESVSRRRE
jgi:hypothetical protein